MVGFAATLSLALVDFTASVELASMFTGGAVLQRDASFAVWGTSSEAVGSIVDVALGDQTLGTAAVAFDGSWMTWLPPQPSTWDVVLTAKETATGSSTSSVVRFGEVVLCSGQSNMQMPLAHPDGQGFSAHNGTAEANAAGRYTNKISLLAPATPSPPSTKPKWNGTNCYGMKDPSDCHPQWQLVSPGPNGTARGFSGLCWHTGKAMFERMDAKVPVGLIHASIGGSPIEAWIPWSRPEAGEPLSDQCGALEPACDLENAVTFGGFFDSFIMPMHRYTIGSVVWDQGERDVHCFAPGTNKTAEYPCMERALIRSWRKVFLSDFAFVAVQLPGYLGDCDSTYPNPDATYSNCVPGVFNMRLAQEEGTKDDPLNLAAVVPTYDLGCPFGVKTDECPWGSVHNVIKDDIADRTALKLLALRSLLPADAVSDGPAAVSVSSTTGASGGVRISVSFDETDLRTSGTQHCAHCCQEGGDGDFDVSFDGGRTWVNGSSTWSVEREVVSFQVAGASEPTHVRYTANQGFPQCAVRNKEGLPAMPFMMPIASATIV